MKKKSVGMFFAVLFLGIAIGVLPSLAAQDDSSSDQFTLEEVTVTAQKREENQQKVPIAMDVITGEELAKQGKLNIDDILKNVANVAIQNTSEGMRVSIRGITDDSGTMSGQHVGGSTVAINVDGTYNNMENVGQNLFDVERVEVLFGPQSTMYGSNAPGGIVNIITAAPKTDKYSASLTQEIGTYHTYNTQIMLNAPVIQDKVALRLAASRNVQDSYVQSGVTANDSKAVRLKGLWNILDNLTFTVTGTWDKMINGGGNASGVVPFDTQDGNWYTSQTVGAGPDAVTVWSKDGKVSDPWTWDGQGVGNSNDQTTKSISAEITWKTSLLNVTATPSYSKSSSTGIGSENNQGQEQEFEMGRGNTQKGAELRITNANDFTLFQWILGGTYYKSVQSSSQVYINSTAAANTQDTTQQKKAIYGNIVYPLWFYDSLRLTAGYRQSWDTSQSVAPGPGGAGLTTSGSPSYTKPDLKYGFEYDATTDMMVYGSYATSYRSGDAMAMPDASGNYPANEELKSYTLGAKSRWLDNRLQLNASAYYYDYKNKLCTGFMAAYGITEAAFGGDYISAVLQTSGPNAGTYQPVLTPDGDPLTKDPVTGLPFTFDLHDPNSQGTGTFTSKGLDLQANWIITSRDMMNVSISYMNETWKTLHFHYYYYMVFPDQDFKGVTPANAPEWSVTADYEHNFLLGAWGTLTPRVDMQYKTSYTLNADPTNPDTMGFSDQESYAKWDLSAAFSSASGKWSINAYCKNITNYAVKSMYRNQQGSVTLNLSEPRRFGATFSIKF